MTAKRVLLLVGSPRGIERSLSGRLGNAVLDALAGRGFSTGTVHTHSVARSPEDLERAFQEVAQADLVVLSLPLYVDSFPAPAIAFLEQVAERTRLARPRSVRTKFALLIQCGFPEREQNATAMRIAERFASAAGWEWLGGLSLGGVDTLRGLPHEALARVAEALAEGRAVPELRVRRTMPAWLYRLGGNFAWRRAAAKFGAAGKLRARPYAE